ncbi:MAG: hypothetical protein WC518_00230 [Patescibacteria group bacterium]
MNPGEGTKKITKNLFNKVIVVGFLLSFFIPALVIAQEVVPGISGVNVADVHDENAFRVATEGGGDAVITCNNFVAGGLATSGDIAALIKCIESGTKAQNKTVDKNTLKQLKALEQKQQREELFSKMKDELKKSMAGAFKTMLRQFSKQLAYDTAVWVASGGKGQQPLFMTEGIGAYLRNQLDNALGVFLDELGRYYGVDVCTPNFQIRALLPGYLGRPQVSVRCSFTKMISNWQSAAQNASFAVEYRRFLRPGENDISSLLMIKTGLSNKLDQELRDSVLNVLSKDGWKDVKDFAGWVLTPGTMVRKATENAIDPQNTSIADYTYTDTLWDFIETFLNTLTGKLLENLMTGFFSSGGNTQNFTTGNSSSSLFNPLAQPFSEGQEGAQERFLSLVEGSLQVGGVYDILNKLTQCLDSSKSNLGPTDCVIDQALAQAIREKKLVKDLSADILNRQFAPSISANINPQTVFTLRNIVILRKYRIVPVGWEVAAKLVNEKAKQIYTLRQLMECYNGCDRFGKEEDFCGNPAVEDTSSWCRGLVDPNWVLKAPELFCRREGYGIESGAIDSQNSVSRDKYCADEQQCIKEDEKGNCLAYGYCTKERRTWDFNSSTCDPKFNTCFNFKSRTGAANAYLANTLDYRDCDAQVAGCRWLATALNPVSNYWLNLTYKTNELGKPKEVLKTCNNPLGCEVTGASAAAAVTYGHNISPDAKTILSQPCNKSAGCSYETSKCTIPNGGVTCSPIKAACDGQNNILAGYNGNFAKCASWNAEKWEEGWGGSENNHHACVTGVGVTGSGIKDDKALASYTLGQQVSSALRDISVEPNKKYILTFEAKKSALDAYGGVTRGSVAVKVEFTDTSGKKTDQGVVLAADDLSDTGYRTFTIGNINNGNNDKFTIKVTTNAGSYGSFYFDEFILREVTENCFETNLVLTNGVQTEDDSNKEIYFDRDIQSCDAKDEGCSQFIRTKAGLGSNLIPNSGFEIDAGGDNKPDGWVERGLTNISLDTNDKYKAKIVYSAEGYDKYPLIPVEAGEYYAISFDAAQAISGNNDEADLEMIFLNKEADAIIGATGIKIDKTNCAQTGDNTITLRNLPANMNMQRQSCYFLVPAGARVMGYKLFSATASGVNFIDNIKLEKINYFSLNASVYTPYTPSERPVSQLAFVKKAPAYYGCYKTGSLWPQSETELERVLLGRSAACANFASVCIRDEVGCERYSPLNKDPAVPGKINALNICPAECVGYQLYRKEKTYFESVSYEKFIADKKPQYCSAAYAGCDEFTNLDEVAKGGESREYYSQLRVCQQPAADASDATYYTWEGSDTTGYQLKTYQLKKSQTDSFDTNAPCTVLDYPASLNGKNQCNDLKDDGTNSVGSVSLPAGYSSLKGYLTVLQGYTDTSSSDPNLPTIVNSGILDELHEFGICAKQELNGIVYNRGTMDDASDDIYIYANADCREFYDGSGQVHYRLLSKAIFSSSECHPYRRSQVQTDTAEAQADCRNSQGYWNANGECIYMAIPGQGKTCPASAKGCRQYVGNQGNNVRLKFFDNFESNLGAWQGGGVLAMEATNPGGKSLKKAGGGEISRPVATVKNKAYILSFWAKASADAVVLDAIKFKGAENNSDNYFAESDSDADNIPQAVLNTTWQKYDLGPVFVTWDERADEALEIKAPAGVDVFFDNIILKEVQQNVYLIANTWFTPFACDNILETPFGSAGDSNNPTRDSQGEMLGCQAYNDRSDQPWYLKSFSRLCREDAVGCEALINTFNSDSPWGKEFNNEDLETHDDVTVQSDQAVYLVNDNQYACQAEDKGCTAFGLPSVTKYDETIGYSTVYLENVPDRYSFDLCRYQNLWCEEFSSADARELSYFKDPRDKLCEYTAISGKNYSNWYAKGTNNPCLTTATQTIGLGSADEKRQPIGWYDNKTETEVADYKGWAGLCPAEQSSCTEYIDPLTEVYEGLFNKEENSFKNCAGETPGAEQNNCGYYVLELEDENLYTISIKRTSSGNVATQLVCDNEIWSPDKSLDVSGSSKLILNRDNVGGDKQVSGRFYLESTGAGQARVNCRIYDPGFDGEEIEVVKAGVYYQLAKAVNRAACNGLVDIDSGCVLFNERGEMNYSKQGVERVRDYLDFDADETFNLQIKAASKNPQPPFSAILPGQKNSNSIIKVSPDRECSGWLFCTTYEKANPEDTDLAFGSQDKCLEIGLCSRFDSKGNCLKYSLGKKEALSTSTPDFQNLTGYSISGYYPTDLMEQIGNAANLPNGNFESTYSGTKEPLGWYIGGSHYDSDNIKQPGQVSGWGDYRFSIERDSANRREGSGYLKLNGAYEAESELVDVFPNVDYTISAWVNTLNLQPTSTQAEILVRELNASGNTIKNSNCSAVAGCYEVKINGISWSLYGGLKLKAGQPWLRVNQRIKTMPETSRLQIKLLNFLSSQDYVNCRDQNAATYCKTGGYTFFDDLQINAALKVNDKENIKRDCRAYPEQDSLACRYFKDNQFFYGWSGYCLTYDPLNSRSCLQWWPVDNIKGEVEDEVSGYDNRVPLYYCLLTEFERELKEVSTDVIQVQEAVGGAMPVASQAQGVAGTILDFLEFILNIVGDVFLGGTNSGTIITDLIAGGLQTFAGIDVGSSGSSSSKSNMPQCERLSFEDLKFDPTTKSLNSWVASITGNNSRNVDAKYLKPISLYNVVYITLDTGYGGGGGVECEDQGGHNLQKVKYTENFILRGLYKLVVGGTSSITTEDYGYVSPGDGTAGLDYSDKTYCAGFVTFFDKDENGHRKGEIKNMIACAQDTGEYTHQDTFNFKFKIGYMTDKQGPACQILAQVVTPMGNNKAWSRRVAKGSIFTMPGLGTSYNSDYPPYGAVVPPEPAHYPEVWDTDLTQKDKQKLYHSAPELESQKPYQARAGEVFSCVNYVNDLPGYDGTMGALRSIFGVASSWAYKVPCFEGCLKGIRTDNAWQGLTSITQSVLCVWRHCTNACNFIGRCSQSGSVCVNYNGFGDDILGIDSLDEQSMPCPISGEKCVSISLWKMLNQNGVPTWIDQAAIRNSSSFIKRLFAKSYGVWTWAGDGVGYKKTDQYNWDVPVRQCEFHGVPNVRPDPQNSSINEIITGWFDLNFEKNPATVADCDWGSACLEPAGCDCHGLCTVPNGQRTCEYPKNPDYCGVAPVINNIRVNKKVEVDVNGVNLSNTPVKVSNNSNVELEFNATLDPEQLPLSAYQVDWGDYKLSYSGIELRDRSNIKNKFKLYHYYSYEKLSKQNTGLDEIYCDGDALPQDPAVSPPVLTVASGECWLKIKIQVRDNWGWCNGSDSAKGFHVSSGKCGSDEAWRNFGRWVVVIKNFEDLDVEEDKELNNDSDLDLAFTPYNGICEPGEDINTEPACPLTSGASFSLRHNTMKRTISTNPQLDEYWYFSTGQGEDITKIRNLRIRAIGVLNSKQWEIDDQVVKNGARFNLVKVPYEVQKNCEVKRLSAVEEPTLGDGDCVYIESERLAAGASESGQIWDTALYSPQLFTYPSILEYDYQFKREGQIENPPTVFKLHGERTFYRGTVITLEERDDDGTIKSGAKYIDVDTEACDSVFCDLKQGSANGFHVCDNQGDCSVNACDGRWDDKDLIYKTVCELFGTDSHCRPECSCEQGFQAKTSADGTCVDCSSGQSCGCPSFQCWNSSSKTCEPCGLKLMGRFALEEAVNTAVVGATAPNTDGRRNLTVKDKDSNFIQEGDPDALLCFQLVKIKNSSGAEQSSFTRDLQNGDIVTLFTPWGCVQEAGNDYVVGAGSGCREFKVEGSPVFSKGSTMTLKDGSSYWDADIAGSGKISKGSLNTFKVGDCSDGSFALASSEWRLASGRVAGASESGAGSRLGRLEGALADLWNNFSKLVARVF